MMDEDGTPLGFAEIRQHAAEGLLVLFQAMVICGSAEKLIPLCPKENPAIRFTCD
ncbi:MAG: hypothetical protein KKG33_05980 [candidate division Zixibacteria bacterium]|nr:hypothetical protein [candidate division Zixibacteria bacterium]MBU1471054.1 hypothetical protein [candidate division Zixibacteria bacterium]MBU2625090.1 hypothetical protein [candidate division Zixibacteria bacterium]